MSGRDGDVISRNSYVYVKNNPLKYVDPSGETPAEILKKMQEAQSAWVRSLEYKAADYLHQVQNYNYQSGNWAGKAGGFLVGSLGDSIENLAKSGDPNVVGGESYLAKGMVVLDVGTFGTGSIAKQGVKGGAEMAAPKVLEMIQPSLRTSFKSGKFAGQTVSSVISKLKTGIISAEEVLVGFVERNGRNIVVNNKSFSTIKGAAVDGIARNLTGTKWAEDLATKLLKQSSDTIYDILKFTKFK